MLDKKFVATIFFPCPTTANFENIITSSPIPMKLFTIRNFI